MKIVQIRINIFVMFVISGNYVMKKINPRDLFQGSVAVFSSVRSSQYEPCCISSVWAPEYRQDTDDSKYTSFDLK